MGAGVLFKVLFTGIGSIAKQHIKNLKSTGDSYIVDALRRKNKPTDGISTIYTDYDEVPNDYDIIFITNPTSLHYEAITKLKDKTKNMFIEKPIFDIPKDCEFSKGVNFVAAPLRFNSEIKKLKQYVETHNVYAFRAICSSYLPDWRKGDYRKCYSAKKEMGGGVELDLIHEIDYLKWIFGNFSNIKRLSAKKSNLEINSNDIALYLFENKDVLGSLHIDYFGREPMRKIEIFSQNETKTFDLLNCSNDMTIEQMQYFIKCVKNKNLNCYNTPKEAIESLEAALI